ncbi:C4b-binding protein beta chain-like [Glandiceps talaboti]
MRVTVAVSILVVVAYLSCGVNIVEGVCAAPDPAPATPLSYKDDTAPAFDATTEYTMEFECDAGYRIEGTASFTCAADATAFTPEFTALPTCLDTCLTPGEVPENGKYKGTDPTFPADKDSTIEYECDEGYTGGGIIKCTGGTWDKDIPTCTEGEDPEKTTKADSEEGSAGIASVNLLVLTAIILPISIFFKD